MANVTLKNLTKEFDKGKPVIKDLDLSISEGEFLVLVGPSGCGKSTTLRLIAGLDDPTTGQIYIDDKLVNDIPPKNRDISMVFQNYALYPHMTVWNNMAFGLKQRKYKKDEIRKRVEEAAAVLEIDELLQRKPKQLSGGQRQRVALGRAIVRKPKVFLFDEPLSNLDAKLRVQMRTEIQKLHQRIRTTMIYVTHDQVEAMTMGDRIAVMKDGIIHQIDNPMNLFNHPVDLFVAGFIGSPSMNFFTARIEQKTTFIADDNRIRINIPRKHKSLFNNYSDDAVIIGIRPEDIYFEAPGKNRAEVQMVLEVVEPMGTETLLYLMINGIRFIAKCMYLREVPEIQKKYSLFIDMNRVHYFNPVTGRVLTAG